MLPTSLKYHRNRHLRTAAPPAGPHLPSGKGRLMGQSPERLWNLPLGPQYFFMIPNCSAILFPPDEDEVRGGWSQPRPLNPVVNMSTVAPRAPAFLVGEVGWGWDHRGTS